MSIIPKQLFEKYGLFDETLPYAEDYDFYLKCVKDGVTMQHLKFCAAVFRIHENQETRKYGNSLDVSIKARYSIS